MEVRVRLRTKHTGLYIRVGGATGVSDVISASTFHLRDGVVRHRGRRVALLYNGTIAHGDDGGGIRFDAGRLMEGDYAIACRADGTFTLTWPDAEDTAQQFLPLAVTTSPLRTPSHLLDAVVTLGVADVTKTETDERMRFTSDLLRDPTIGVYALQYVDERVLMTLMRLHTFGRGACQLVSSYEHAHRRAIVYDSTRFECLRAAEMIRSGGIVVMLRCKTRKCIFVVACLGIDGAREQTIGRLARQLGKKLQTWPHTAHRIALLFGREAPWVARAMAQNGWSPKAHLDNTHLYCSHFDAHVSVPTDELVLQNGTTLRGQVREEHDNGVYVETNGRLTWVAHATVKRRRRDAGSANHALMVCALHTVGDN